MQLEREGKAITPASAHKIYRCCRTCGQAMTSTGHTQFRGQRYCPYVTGDTSRNEWLQAKKQEVAVKKAGGQ